MLTQDQITGYVECGGVKCPYCGSQDIQAMERDETGLFSFQLECCFACGATWSAKYQLVGIEEDEE